MACNPGICQADLLRNLDEEVDRIDHSRRCARRSRDLAASTSSTASSRGTIRPCGAQRRGICADAQRRIPHETNDGWSAQIDPFRP